MDRCTHAWMNKKRILPHLSIIESTQGKLKQREESAVKIEKMDAPCLVVGLFPINLLYTENIIS